MDQAVRTLHLEDDATDAELVQATLESAGLACEIKWVQTREEFCEALRAGRYDVVLADYRLPMFDGMSALRLVRECDLDVPFIFVSGTMGEDAAIEALTEGATDYVLKQKLSRLSSAVKRALQEAEDQRERRRAEEELRRVNRALRILNNTNQALIQIPDEATLLNEVCRIAVEVGGYRLLWVGFARRDEAKTVRPVAQAGFNDGYLESAHITWADSERGRGPIGTAIRTGQPCIVHDTLSDPAFAPWREEALRRGYKSLLALPLTHKGRTFGALNVYAGEVDAFDAKEVEILKEMADDLAFGIAALRTRARRDLAEEALRHSEKEKTILNEIANIFLTIPDEAMYGEVLAVVLRVMRSKYGIFGFVGEHGDLIIPSLTREVWNECRIQGKSLVFPADSWGDSLWGKAIRGKKAFSSDGPFRTPEGHLHIDHYLTTPVVFGEESIGLISIANKEGGYVEDDKDLLERIAGYVSPILNARLQRDLLERKRMQAVEALRKSERSLKEAQHIAHLGSWDLDIATNHLRWSDEAYEIFGLTHQEFSATYEGFLEGVHPDDRADVDAAYMNSVQHDVPFDIVHRIIRRSDGMIRYVHETCENVKDDTGKIIRSLGTTQDVTERIRMQKEQEKLQSQLIQAQQMEAIGTLAGGIAHDFNNILSGIMGYSELCLNAVQDRPKVHQGMEQVLKAADRAKGLVRQILTFSRKSEQEKTPIALAPIVKEVVKFIRASLPATIEIRQTIDVASDVMFADPTQMHQVLMNLCTNAGHAMKETGGVLEIGLNNTVINTELLAHHPSLRCGHYLELTVRDTGHGIPERNLGRIFEPYFTTKEKGEGTGLGLAVVHGIVKDHGGEIRVYSEVGKGTVFKVYLPLMEKQIEEGADAGETVLQGKGETILFVDDERMVVNLNRELLESIGYKVFTETDPRKAIEVFKKYGDAFDLVITDKTMPHMTGFDVAREIRSIRADIPVLLCSGFQGTEDMEKLAPLGISQFITKPIRMSVLAKAIRDALDKKPI